MAKTFEINGRKYVSQEFTYNTICDLQDAGINIDAMGDRSASMVRAFFSIWSGMTLEEAGAELGKHMMAGGNLDAIGAAINDSMENSDFFRSLAKTAEANTTASKSKKSKSED